MIFVLIVKFFVSKSSLFLFGKVKAIDLNILSVLFLQNYYLSLIAQLRRRNYLIAVKGGHSES